MGGEDFYADVKCRSAVDGDVGKLGGDENDIFQSRVIITWGWSCGVVDKKNELLVWPSETQMTLVL